MNQAELNERLARHRQYLKEPIIFRQARFTARDEDLSGLIMVSADLRHADLEGCRLHKASLVGADLCSARIVRCDLTQANLRSANLENALVMGCDLSGARLISANLMDADLTDSKLEGADLAGAAIHEAVLPDGFAVASLCFGGWPVTIYPRRTSIGCIELPNHRWLGMAGEDLREHLDWDDVVAAEEFYEAWAEPIKAMIRHFMELEA